MVVGFAEIIIIGLAVEWGFRRLHMPGFLGIMLAGVMFGPFVLQMIDVDLLTISPELRLICLIVILLRAGLEINFSILCKIGFRVISLSVIPPLIETAVVTLTGRLLLGFSYMESAILGLVLAAVSPAVVVPIMIEFARQGKGMAKNIPSMILLTTALDNIFVILACGLMITIYVGTENSVVRQIIDIPFSVIIGIVVGLISGVMLFKLFERFNPRATKRTLIVIAVAVIMVRVESFVSAWIPFAALVSAITIGVVILEKNESMGREISAKLARLWVFAQLILFIMIGAQVNLSVVWSSSFVLLIVLICGVSARMIGVLVCLLGSGLNSNERKFVAVSLIPKATVQAVLGAAPLMAMAAAGMNTKPGETILAAAVLSIFVTAPLGDWGIRAIGKRL